MLDVEMSAVAWMMQCFPEIKEIDDMRKSIGRYGLTGKQQVLYICCIHKFSSCVHYVACVENEYVSLIVRHLALGLFACMGKIEMFSQ